MTRNQELGLTIGVSILTAFLTAWAFFTCLHYETDQRLGRMEAAMKRSAPIMVNIHVTTPQEAQKTLKALLPTLDEMRAIRS